MQPSCFSIQSFCDFHKISRSHFYDLLKQGKGPVIMKLGRRIVIRPEAVEVWQLSIEAQTNQLQGEE